MRECDEDYGFVARSKKAVLGTTFLVKMIFSSKFMKYYR
jgi:hypothetical protein